MKNNYKLQFINGGLKSYKVCCKTRLSGHYTPNPILGSAACKIQKHIQFTAALLLLALCSMSGAEVQAQNNVGIGTTTPNPKAVLELNSNDKGFLAPRMNTTFMNAIAPTATENALLIYNTDSACYHFYNGVAWKNLCQKGIDTALINKAIKNYLGSANFTTIINNAIVNNAIIDTSITNYTNINNAVIDTSITNYANINNAIIDTSITNYANINNAVIDSSVTNYAQVGHLQGGWGSMDSLQIGGKNIMKTISDSIGAQAWLKKGNITNASNFIGTI
ncbi:MAG: hypothetical protein H7331_07015, partial [Bacteroidia bacterium]|nr:hypothetical protein [Bacteroidia bacterium]